MDLNEELDKLDKTGEYVIGSNETLELTQSGESKLTVLSTTCPPDVEKEVRESADKNDVSLYYFDGGSEDLGLALGKPFLVSAMAIIDSGDSSILELGGNYK